MQFSQSFLDGIIKFLYSLERYFHVVLKTDLNISLSTTQSVFSQKTGVQGYLAVPVDLKVSINLLLIES